MNTTLKEKTWKREYAAVLMALLVCATIKVFWFVAPDNVKAYEGLLMGIFWPILAFVAAVAGIHTFLRAPGKPPGRD